MRPDGELTKEEAIRHDLKCLPITKICEKYGISRRTFYRKYGKKADNPAPLGEAIEPVSLEMVNDPDPPEPEDRPVEIVVEPPKTKAPKRFIVPATVTREQALDILGRMHLDGEWSRLDVPRLSQEWHVTQRVVREWSIEAAVKVGASLSAFQLAATHRDVVDKLRNIADKAEKRGDLKLAAFANAEVGRLVGSLIRGGLMAQLTTAKHGNRSEEEIRTYLIEKEGWLPGAQPGLPSLNSDNPSDIEKEEEKDE